MDSQDKRDNLIQKHKQLLQRAGDLYIGNQAKLVKKAISVLRKKNEVDYYIISAGFGMVNENTLLPPYECTFSDKGKSKIRMMASELGIQERINQLPRNYDLIYLVLGKKYLLTLDMRILADKTKLLIMFGLSGPKSSNLILIDPNILLKVNQSQMNQPLGNHLSNKAALLLNYAYDFDKNQESFPLWWKRISRDIKRFDTLNKNDNHFYNTVQIVNKQGVEQAIGQKKIKWSGNRIMTELTQKETNAIDKFVGKFTKKEINGIIDLTKGLDTVNTKKGETRKEWVKKHEDKVDGIRVFLEKSMKFIEDMQDDTGIAKGKIKNYLINQIRAEQEQLGHDSSLLNGPRMSIMNTLINWVDNPELQEIESVYIPRDKSRGKKGRKTIGEPSMDIHLSSWRETSKRFEIIVTLTNKSPYPLQNLEIKLTSKADNYPLSIDVAKGNQVEVDGDTVLVHFVPASMTGDEHSEDIRIVSDSLIEENESIIALVSQDYAADNTRVESSFELQ